jgi:uncharacterized protein (DUF433 family)
MRIVVELDAETKRRLKDARAKGDAQGLLNEVAKDISKLADELKKLPTDLLLKSTDSDGKVTLTSGGTWNAEPIKSTAGVMGGDACIRDTRIPVWTLVSYKSQGLSDEDILAAFPGLNASDLLAAWDFYAANGALVEAQRKSHEDAA